MRRLSCTATAVAVAAGVALVAAPAAGARVLETTYYTINVKPSPGSRSGALFLGTDNRAVGRPVTLRGYRPNDSFMQWTPVWPEYPGPAEITGGSGVGTAIGEIFSDCFVFPWPLPVGCKFQGAQTPSFPFKFVNRASGLCISVAPTGPTWSPPAYGNGTPVLQGRCLSSPPNPRRFQIWTTQRIAETNRSESTLWQFHFRPRCLDVRDFREAAGAPLQIWACHGGVNWNQQFRFLRVASARCEIGVTNKICGLPDSPPSM